MESIGLCLGLSRLGLKECLYGTDPTLAAHVMMPKHGISYSTCDRNDKKVLMTGYQPCQIRQQCSVLVDCYTNNNAIEILDGDKINSNMWRNQMEHYNWKIASTNQSEEPNWEPEAEDCLGQTHEDLADEKVIRYKQRRLGSEDGDIEARSGNIVMIRRKFDYDNAEPHGTPYIALSGTPIPGGIGMSAEELTGYAAQAFDIPVTLVEIIDRPVDDEGRTLNLTEYYRDDGDDDPSTMKKGDGSNDPSVIETQCPATGRVEYTCLVCNMRCGTWTMYQSHLLAKKHKKYLKRETLQKLGKATLLHPNEDLAKRFGRTDDEKDDCHRVREYDVASESIAPKLIIIRSVRPVSWKEGSEILSDYHKKMLKENQRIMMLQRPLADEEVPPPPPPIKETHDDDTQDAERNHKSLRNITEKERREHDLPITPNELKCGIWMGCNGGQCMAKCMEPKDHKYVCICPLHDYYQSDEYGTIGSPDTPNRWIPHDGVDHVKGMWNQFCDRARESITSSSEELTKEEGITGRRRRKRRTRQLRKKKKMKRSSCKRPRAGNRRQQRWSEFPIDEDSDEDQSRYFRRQYDERDEAAEGPSEIEVQEANPGQTWPNDGGCDDQRDDNQSQPRTKVYLTSAAEVAKRTFLKKAVEAYEPWTPCWQRRNLHHFCDTYICAGCNRHYHWRLAIRCARCDELFCWGCAEYFDAEGECDGCKKHFSAHWETVKKENGEDEEIFHITNERRPNAPLRPVGQPPPYDPPPATLMKGRRKEILTEAWKMHGSCRPCASFHRDNPRCEWTPFCQFCHCGRSQTDLDATTLHKNTKNPYWPSWYRKAKEETVCVRVERFMPFEQEIHCKGRKQLALRCARSKTGPGAGMRQYFDKPFWGAKVKKLRKALEWVAEEWLSEDERDANERENGESWQMLNKEQTKLQRRRDQIAKMTNVHELCKYTSGRAPPCSDYYLTGRCKHATWCWYSHEIQIDADRCIMMIGRSKEKALLIRDKAREMLTQPRRAFPNEWGQNESEDVDDNEQNMLLKMHNRTISSILFRVTGRQDGAPRRRTTQRRNQRYLKSGERKISYEASSEEMSEEQGSSLKKINKGERSLSPRTNEEVVEDERDTSNQRESQSPDDETMPKFRFEREGKTIHQYADLGKLYDELSAKEEMDLLNLEFGKRREQWFVNNYLVEDIDDRNHPPYGATSVKELVKMIEQERVYQNERRNRVGLVTVSKENADMRKRMVKMGILKKVKVGIGKNADLARKWLDTAMNCKWSDSESASSPRMNQRSDSESQTDWASEVAFRRNAYGIDWENPQEEGDEPRRCAAYACECRDEEELDPMRRDYETSEFLRRIHQYGREYNQSDHYCHDDPQNLVYYEWQNYMLPWDLNLEPIYRENPDVLNPLRDVDNESEEDRNDEGVRAQTAEALMRTPVGWRRRSIQEAAEENASRIMHEYQLEFLFHNANNWWIMHWCDRSWYWTPERRNSISDCLIRP